eukprot:scaffold40526_cov71-Phaeocystis_antarctica.AAC.2
MGKTPCRARSPFSFGRRWAANECRPWVGWRRGRRPPATAAVTCAWVPSSLVSSPRARDRAASSLPWTPCRSLRGAWPSTVGCRSASFERGGFEAPWRKPWLA